jgi:hypothetical protein
MSGEQNPCFERNRAIVAQSAELSLLQDAQELQLGMKAQLPNFVKKKSPFARCSR